jgi:hypothetical protein
MNASDVAVTNTDNDTAGITVSAISGNTTEAGGTATFTVVLDSQPTADVTIGISSNDLTEGTVSVSSLTFTAANWNVAQTVTVAGIDDAVDDGDIAYSILTAAATSADGNYNGMNAADVAVTNVDNDTAGITVSAISGDTTEAGGTATFTVVLDSAPTADVTIGLSSNDLTEGTVSVSSLTFTAANWNIAQTVTVTGVDDFVDDGNITYSILTAAATSADGSYNGMNAADVAVTNTDDDGAGITVSVISGNTTEAGGTATFTVMLNSQPTADVTIAIASNNAAEGTASVSSLVFAASNWNVAQTVTVTGVDEFVDDGDITYSIVTAPAASTDTNYNNRDAGDVTVTNADDDTAGITLSSAAGLTTTEAGGTASFTAVLTSQPTADVTIAIASSNTAEGTVSDVSITFTAANWNVPQTVMVTGVNEFIDDGNAAYSVITSPAVSIDPTYNGFNPANVSVTNLDDDVTGITVTPTSGMVTTEAAGTATFTLVLMSQPTSDVTIPISSSDSTEGNVSTSLVTFTAANWNVPQTVTVTGVNDFVDDGDIAYMIVTAPVSRGDGTYDRFNAADVSVTNSDNDTAGITVTPTSGLVTTEVGGAATFTIVLTTQPTADVTLGVSSHDTTEGTVSPASFTFTAANWYVPQTVTVTGVDDFVDDANIGYSIVTAPASSADPLYNGLNSADVSVTNTDNDTAGFTITTTSGLVTTETGGMATFTVRLTSLPTADVSIALASNDATEGTVAPASLVFTAANWNTAQTVTVTGVDDVVDDGNISFTITTAAATSVDPNYNGLNPSDVTVSNTDNDTAGITVTPTSSLVTTETGGSDRFTVVLVTQPSANVTINLSSSDMTEGTVAPASITFSPANWNVPQTVTVTGVDDTSDTVDVAYTIVTGPATSTDANYNGINAADVSVTNLDDDQNVPPTASAGADQVVEGTLTAGGPVTLAGSASDPNGDTLSYQWTEGGVVLSSQLQPTLNLSYGVHTLTLTVNDGRGGVATDSVTINVADTIGPMITDVQFVTTGKRITALALEASEALDAAGAANLSNFGLYSAGTDRLFGTADDLAVALSAASYDAAARTIRLTPTRPIKAGRFIELVVRDSGLLLDLLGNRLDGDMDHTPGGDAEVLVLRGTKVRYTDTDGDRVSIRFRGGALELARTMSGDATHVRLLNSGLATSTIRGTVKRAGAGDGQTTIDLLSGSAGVTKSIPNPPITTAQEVASAVDLLLALGEL